MNICLKTYAKQADSKHIVVHLQERLPARVHAPCDVVCDFNVETCRDYYLLTLAVHSELMITCQRCLGHFQYEYQHQTQLAVCATDAMAEQLMERFDCIVAPHHQLDLMEVLTDELHLFLPEKHLDGADCDAEISQLISDNECL